MKYRKLGGSGLEVSEIGLGTNNFGQRLDFESSDRVISQCIDSGINLIDTSNSYGATLSEEYIGRSLVGRRDGVVLATKVSSRMAEGPNQAGNSRIHIMDQIDASLARLQTDYIDLYQIHWWDDNTPIEETLRALDDLVRDGKIRYFGCSNFSSWQVCESVWTSRSVGINSFVSVQPHYSMMERSIESELLPFCQKYDVGVLPYYPLANGFLTGKYRRGENIPEGTRLGVNDRGMFTEENFDLIEKLDSFSSKREKTVLDLAFAWLLARDEISSVIAGATSAEQVVSNAATAEFVLTKEEYNEVSSILA
ncbi:MAG: aldo/keto reductase [SAR202 cluster bacterium]|jgi:aryl-alcohol dehydrogenase-like predicted oxidoreductase|nr:MAG: aldo/keto reductase [SAR202 cluster bacterium]MCH2318460.1 aldo/keto reductase [SAR202 cluster bacterium]MQF68584.1 aldo/keto reductase [SAR202 cluster bacterium AD-802-K11_MRT_200m]MQG74736.1 aldo/keto reductase [SAR202 cluster bacterium]|tara:strand:+ start:5656 stop:6582 length:927 start_codon:yes stop_codon:yes gene_type:complete